MYKTHVLLAYTATTQCYLLGTVNTKVLRSPSVLLCQAFSRSAELLKKRLPNQMRTMDQFSSRASAWRRQDTGASQHWQCKRCGGVCGVKKDW